MSTEEPPETPASKEVEVQPPAGEGGGSTAAAAELPFSDMISRWLDDGERLHERAVSDDFGTDFAPEGGRVAAFVDGARTFLHRHRTLLSGIGVLAAIVIWVAFRHTRAVNNAPSAVVVATVVAPSPPSISRPIERPSARPSAPAPPPAPVVVAAAKPEPPAQAEIAPAPVVAPKTPSPLEACRSALKRQRSHDALASCRRAASAAPRSANALVLLARADLLAGHQSETLQVAHKAVTMNPRFPEAYLLIGSVEQNAGHKREARTAYETYLRLQPRGPHAADLRAILKKL
jgi:hypothetical protein